MTKIFVILGILFVGLLCEAAGIVYLSTGIKEIGPFKEVSVGEVVRVIKTGATNHRIWLGMAFETAFFVTLLIMMSKGTVSFVWPLTSLSVVFTTVAARYFLNEPVSTLRWGGVLLIMLGAGVVTYTEKVLEQKKPQAPIAQSDAAQ
jgi:drug/metabolite transporter (DMT)-like permease